MKRYKSKVLHVRIDKEIFDDVKEIASQYEISIAEFVRKGINNALDPFTCCGDWKRERLEEIENLKNEQIRLEEENAELKQRMIDKEEAYKISITAWKNDHEDLKQNLEYTQMEVVQERGKANALLEEIDNQREEHAKSEASLLKTINELEKQCSTIETRLLNTKMKLQDVQDRLSLWKSKPFKMWKRYKFSKKNK